MVLLFYMFGSLWSFYKDPSHFLSPQHVKKDRDIKTTMLKNVTIFYTQLYTPTLYSQSANTDIHTPSPQRTEIRYAMSTRLYTP